jgi:hypothetical protein
MAGGGTVTKADFGTNRDAALQIKLTLGVSTSSYLAMLGGAMKAFWRIAVCFFFVLVPMFVAAQVAASAPIPVPILNAKKVFVGNSGTDLNAQANGNAFSQDLGVKAYESFYQGLQAWGHYQLVDNPADADLVFEIGVRSQWQDGSHNIAGNTLRFDVLVLDAKTHFTLWRFVEGFDYFGPREAGREKNFNRHMEHLIGLLKELVQTAKQ